MAMSDKKILDALQKMRAVADDIRNDFSDPELIPDLSEVVAERIDPDTELTFTEGEPKVFAHVLFMLQETAELVRQNRREKAMRWLGFLQGVMWVQGWCSLEALKKMNMPDEPKKET